MVSMQGIDKVSTGIGEKIEPGIYDVQVTKVEDGIALKGGQSGYGTRFHFKVLNDGPMKGREVQHLLNVQATHADNQKYSLQELAGMAVSSGVPEQAVLGQNIDTQNMMGRYLSVVLGPQKNKPEFVEVKGYLPSNACQDPANWEKVKDKLVASAATQQGPAQTQGGWGGSAPAAQQPAATGAWNGSQGGQPQPQAQVAQPQAQVQAQPQAQNTWGSGPS
jgi:hypothetical protein